MKPKSSLISRLTLASLLVLPILLLLSGYMLERGIRHSLLASETQLLQGQIYQLLTAAEFEQGELWLPEQLPEARFSQLDSGLYGMVKANQHTWLSESAQLKSGPMPVPELSQVGVLSITQTTWQQEAVFVAAMQVEWESQNNQNLTFVVAHHSRAYEKEVGTFRTQLFWWLLVLVVVLTAAQVIIVKFGLRPLGLLADELNEMEQGKRKQLSHGYPKELLPLANNINHLVESLRKQQKRFSQALADLAHSLKTPLALARGVGTHHPELNEHIDRMDNIISHQLTRANRGVNRLDSQWVDANATVRRLAAVMPRLYADKGIRAELVLAEHAGFRGQEDDLMEVLGNLIENACKYGRHSLKVTTILGEHQLDICIEDDGPGIAADVRDKVLQRGVRLDSQQQGQGIGLAVAADIVEAYEGNIRLSASSLGGLSIHIRLPGGVFPSVEA